MNAVKQTTYLIAAALLFWLIFSLSGVAQSQGITIKLEPQGFSVDRTARLTVEVEGTRNAEVTIGEVDDLVIKFRGKINNFNYINGSATSSITFSYTIQALQPGTYTIPDISVIVDGNDHKAEPISFSVAPAATAAPAPAPQSPDGPATAELDSIAFIVFTPAKETSYLGEVVPVQIKAYFKQGARVDQISLPRFQAEGLLLDELDRNPNQTEEIIGNVPYRVLVWDSFLTGVKEGRYEIELELEATLLIPSGRRSPFPGFGSNFFDDDFFGDVFSSYQSKPITATSARTALSVIGLPETAKPEGFTGAVGNFSLDLEANPTEVAVGEPITLTMSVSGTGNFNRVEAPVISDPDKLKLYTPQGAFTPGNSPYDGNKRFEQAAVITDPSLGQIPPVVFSFFNPDSGQYQTLFSDPVNIRVTPAAAETIVQNRSTRSDAPEVEPAAQTAPSTRITLIPVKLDTGRLVEEIRPPFLTPRFIAALALSLLMITGLGGYGFYQRSRSRNPDALYRKALNASKKETLARLTELDPGDPGYPDQARQNIEKLLIVVHQNQGLSLTLADIIEKYGDRSVVTELFRLSDKSRYEQPGAGKTSPPDEQEELHQNLVNFIRTLP